MSDYAEMAKQAIHTAKKGFNFGDTVELLFKGEWHVNILQNISALLVDGDKFKITFNEKYVDIRKVERLIMNRRKKLKCYAINATLK